MHRHFFLSYKIVFVTKFVTCITNFVTCVRNFVTSVTNFVTNFFCADSKKYQAESKNFLLATKNFQAGILAPTQHKCKVVTGLCFQLVTFIRLIFNRIARIVLGWRVFRGKKMRIENGECDSPDTKKSAALPCDKAADFVHSQGLEPWTHWLRVSCSTNWAKSASFINQNLMQTCTASAVTLYTLRGSNPGPTD